MEDRECCVFMDVAVAICHPSPVVVFELRKKIADRKIWLEA